MTTTRLFSAVLLWIAIVGGCSRPAAAQKDVPPEIRPYLHSRSVVDFSRAQLIEFMPELRNLDFAQDQAPLSPILKKVGENVEVFFKNFPNTSSLESRRSVSQAQVLLHHHGAHERGRSRPGGVSDQSQGRAHKTRRASGGVSPDVRACVLPHLLSPQAECRLPVPLPGSREKETSGARDWFCPGSGEDTHLGNSQPARKRSGDSETRGHLGGSRQLPDSADALGPPGAQAGRGPGSAHKYHRVQRSQVRRIIRGLMASPRDAAGFEVQGLDILKPASLLAIPSVHGPEHRRPQENQKEGIAKRMGSVPYLGICGQLIRFTCPIRYPPASPNALVL
jgi:hypothetical protein